MQAISIGSEYNSSVEDEYSVSPASREDLYSLASKEEKDEFEDCYEDRQQIYNGTEEFPEFTNHHTLTKTKDKSLKSDLKACGFPPNIIAKGDEIFFQMNSGLKRGTRRKQLVYFCATKAYDVLGIPEDPSKIATMCGITTSGISKANSMCSPSKTNYKAPAVHWEPKDFFKGYFQKIIELDLISFSETALNDVEEICAEVMEKSQALRDEKPQTVAAAVLIHYLQMNNCAIEKKKYNEIFGKSDMTLAKAKKKVSDAYNS